uniref:PH domain-containing protein n=1 Tax=Cyclopterus lumpus TaxID=8103 RepID=A0A8C2X0Z0_CYCLU
VLTGGRLSPCNKFQANIFNKSKCQNCFKSRELHLLTDNGMEQAKPLYGGWLCLAPEGTDFDNPMQKSRKWQRRFFILYEDGSLSFALDELTSTLPQGTVNLNLCTDVADAEPKTGQRNALCIVTPEQEIFIRGDNKEIINGWTEQLAVYLRTNKQNQKKKRKVELVATQEPSPAKMAATDPSFPSSGNAPESGCGRGQEDPQQGSGPGETPMWTVLDSDPRGLDKKTPAGAAEAKHTHTHTFPGFYVRWPIAATSCPPSHCPNVLQMFSHSQLLVYTFHLTLVQPGNQNLFTLFSLQPDLLNFKKGWMVKLEENEQWKKYWFVLSMDSLRCYKDSVAEEASDLNGEIDLTRCYSVSEYLVQRNYGFQIHTPKGVFTLSAMTSGIRRNWIQALMKNVRPAKAPDVASLPGPAEALPKPDVTQDSADDPHPKRRSVMERRREGRYKTFDWAEFRPQNKRSLDPQRTKALCSLEFGELERRKRREDRRRRYESMLGSPLGWEAIGGTTSGVRALSPKSQQKVDEEIEECWKQVEKTVFRLERNVPLIKLLYELFVLLKVEDLKAQLAESERHRLDLEAQLSSAGLYTQQVRRFKCVNVLQVTCERGFASMEESHLKVVEELQRRHQQEVERLLVGRDALLEEESAATATALQAITNAHRLELEKEVQKRCRCQDGTGDAHLENVHRQHREESASYQRELEVLSQQFSLKCLENGHLVQALDAERKALCQCQQENQDLRTRNQELSGHLAAEITRLCSLAKEDALPLSQGMGAYEMEITLRVKESELQCLKQEITSLRDDLQSAQRDKRIATKKCKSMYTELSITRAKMDRDTDELRGNLRLAHRSLDSIQHSFWRKKKSTKSF